MVDQNIEALKALQTLQQNSKKEKKEEKPEVPFFMDVAEKIPYELQDFVASYKRKIHDSLSPDNLLWAVGEEVTTYEVRKGFVTQVLKMRLEENQAPVYVFAGMAGEGYRHLDNYIAQRFKIGIVDFLETDTKDDEGNEQYIALGSLQQASFTVIGLDYKEYLEDPEAFKAEDRTGVVTQVIDTPDFRFVSFEYKGVQLGMLAKNFYYQSFAHPLSEVAYIGMRFKFRITDIKRVKFEDIASVKEDLDNHRPAPKGLTYQVRTTRLPFLASPDDEVIRLYESGSDFLGNIVRCHPVKGILVEIKPGWWIKGMLSSNSPIQPTIADAKAHTPVVVRIESLNKKDRTGRAYIIRFPRGVVRVPRPQDQ